MNKSQPIKDKLKIYKLDITPKLAKRCIHDVTENGCDIRTLGHVSCCKR